MKTPWSASSHILRDGERGRHPKEGDCVSQSWCGIQPSTYSDHCGDGPDNNGNQLADSAALSTICADSDPGTRANHEGKPAEIRMPNKPLDPFCADRPLEISFGESGVGPFGAS